MEIKTGIDIVKIEDFKKRIENPGFVKRVFLQTELENKNAEHLAGLFALKEAYFKASQAKIKKWTDIEIKSENGKPMIVCTEDYLSIDGSISHNGDYAVAVVVIIKK